MAKDTAVIRYRFRSSEGIEEIYNLVLDLDKVELLDNVPDELPEWTRLDFHQCPHCPLSNELHTHCPLAMNLVKTVERFKTMQSFDKLHMEVQTEERTISQDSTAQRGLGSMLGLIIGTSGCPHTKVFRPMARFHLPLANETETLYRAITMYLAAQYFLHEEGHEFDFSLKGLEKIYENMHVINHHLAERLRDGPRVEPGMNAIAILDIFTQTLPLDIGNATDNIRNLFRAFFEKGETLESKAEKVAS